MISIKLKDSHFLSTGIGIKYDDRDANDCMFAIDSLNKQFQDGTVQLLSLNGLSKKVDIDCPISYTITNRTNNKTDIEFLTSHYIGYYSNEKVKIVINPHLGEKAINYLLSYAYSVYLPSSYSNYINEKSNSYFLIALLWKALLEKAVSTSQIPKEYITESKNLKHFRGKLHINKHIHYNLVDQSNFYCTYRKFTFDNTINRTIRHTYEILKGKVDILKNVNEYDDKLAMCGVRNTETSLSEIDKIKYTKLNLVYKSIMSLSKVIIANKSSSSTLNSNNKAPLSYFIDIAELWETYLLKLLQRHLDEKYNIYSPNNRGGEYLLENSQREIRPDIIIEEGDKVIMIIDAKFKGYSRFGRIAKGGISREDLYQMNTYLYHYGVENEIITGIFVSHPFEDHENNYETYSYVNHQKHKIGLVKLNINYSSQDEIHLKEIEFIKTINGLLAK